MTLSPGGSSPSRAEQAAAALRQGDLPMADRLCRQGLEAEPDAVWPGHYLALLCHRAGDNNGAIDQLWALTHKHGQAASAWNDLGSLLMAQGRLDEAERALRTAALHASPAFAGAYYNLGNLLRLKGALTEAEQAYGEALSRQPGHVGSLHNLALTLLDQGRPRAALLSARTARAVAPRRADEHFLEGNILRGLGQLSDALACYDRAVELAPGHAACHTNRGNLLTEQGRAGDAIGAYRAAVKAAPSNPRYASNLLCSLHYADGITPEILRRAHRSWDRRFGCPEPPPRPAASPRPGGSVLTVGLISAGFGHHPVGWFTLPLVEGAAPAGLRIILYSDRQSEDPLTGRLREGAAGFRRIVGMDDTQAAGRIAADGVDVLIDMSGHTGGNRLRLFAGRAAPLQATWAAYAGTTGVAAIDLLIADAQQIPPGEDGLYRERVVRLPVGYVPYAPPAYAPDVVPPPDPARGLVLGSFNNPAKLSAHCLRLWARTLAAIPQARLLIKFRYLDDGPTARHLRARFATLGGDGSRLDIEGGCPHKDLLAAYGRLHLALDTFPYSGGLTTLEALWMGVPVLTLPGRTFASRHSLTHLSHLGLGALCATSSADFVRKAQALAADPHRLAQYRENLRPRMAQAPLCDGRTFARHFSRALRQAWESCQAWES